MSPDEMIPGPDSCSTDVAAYALGALGDAEAAAFRRHLESCAVCPIELAAFRQVVDDLATSAPRMDAPRSLRREVMRAVDAEPRLHPAARRQRRASRPRWALALPRPALALSGGVALVAAAVLVVVLALPGGGSAGRTIAADVTGAGAASLQVSHDRAELVLHHFPPPPRGKIYEVWLKRGTTTTRSTLFSVTDGAVDVPGTLHGVNQVLVTTEPAGGTQTPTTAPVISASL